jgi:hypothetical protein
MSVWMLGRLTTADYEAWKVVFDSKLPLRQSHGLMQQMVFRDGDVATVVLEFPDAAAMEGFRTDPALRAAMQESGVTAADMTGPWEKVS